jgi:hypothetical protein
VLLPLALVLAGSSGVALASRTGDDRARAEALVTELERIPAHAQLAHEAIEKAKQSARRADEARAAGDRAHAPELDALGREWAETGADLVRAADAEKELDKVQRELTRVETQTTRARALLEETLARRGRARAKLEELEKQPAGSGGATLAAPSSEKPAGAKAPPATPPKPKKTGAPTPKAPARPAKAPGGKP